MNKKVLIVDDHELIFSGLKGYLENIELLFAQSQDEVDNYLYSEQIASAVIDVTIGNDNGFDVAYKIRNHVKHIFFLSMHKSPLYIHKAMEEGYAGYFLKDEPLDLLSEALRKPDYREFWMSDSVSSIIKEEGSRKFELYDRLSPREQQILRLLAEGIGYKDIGQELNISAKTVNVHRANIFKKLGLEKQVDIVKYAIKIGLIDL